MTVKKWIVLLLLSWALAGCSGPTRQPDTPPLQQPIRAEPPAKSIRMSGYGKVFYEADICDLSFMVVTEAGDDLTRSFEEHRAKTDAISSFMKTYGDSSTICAQTATVLKEQNQGRVYQTDYSARVPIEEDVAILQRELIERGVNRIVKMELRSSKYKELLKQCRDLAIADARSKIAYIANVTRREIVDLVEVDLTTENISSWRYGRPPQLRQYGSRARSIETPDSSFETYIDVTLQVTFLLRKPNPQPR